MEVTTAERYASGGPGRELYAPKPREGVPRTPWSGSPTTRPSSTLRAIRRPGPSCATAWRGSPAGLPKLGVGKGDTVALMMNNRPSSSPATWRSSRLAACRSRSTRPPRPSRSPYVVSDAGAKVAIVETMFLDVFGKAREELPAVETIVVIDGDGGDSTLAELESSGEGYDVSGAVDADRARRPADADLHVRHDGPAEGSAAHPPQPDEPGGGVEDLVEFPERGAKVISWLPAAHIAERGANYYLPVIKGPAIHICPDPRKVVEFLPQVNPTWFFAVPRIWEKLKAGLEAKLANLPDDQSEPAQQGLQAAIQKVRLEQAGEDVPDELAAGVAKADEALFANLRKALGLDEVMAVNVGRRADSRSRCSSSSTPSGSRSASCGGCPRRAASRPATRPARSSWARSARRCPGIEIKLADDGEVLVQGRLEHARLPQHARQDGRDDRRGRLAPDRRHRRARRGRLPEDRRPQEGADHQRGRQEHVAGQHRGDAEGREPADRPGGRRSATRGPTTSR